MAVLPLAALAMSAVPAHAGVIGVSGGSVDPCNASASSDFGGQAACSFSSTPTGGVSDLNWLSMSGFAFVSGGGNIVFGVPSGGSAAGSISAENISVAYDFNIDNLGSGSPVTWTLTYKLFEDSGQFGVPPNHYGLTFSGSTSQAAEIQNTGTFAVPAGQLVTYEIMLSASSASGFDISIPGGRTLDINPQSSAPEPASWLLAGTGAALLALVKRRRKA